MFFDSPNIQIQYILNTYIKIANYQYLYILFVHVYCIVLIRNIKSIINCNLNIFIRYVVSKLRVYIHISAIWFKK